MRRLALSLRWALLAWVGLSGLSAAAVTPQEPRIAALATPGKPPDLFAQEDEDCREQAAESVGADNATETVVGSAAIGAVVGAAAGALVAGRHDRQNLTGAGALAGLVVGSAAGLNRNAAASAAQQRQYDQTYQRCMVGKGNYLPGAQYQHSVVPVPPPAPYAAQPGLAAPPPPPPPPPVRP
ncbi:MAG: hypothetical protein ACR2I0_04785 [Rhodoferax sp.]